MGMKIVFAVMSATQSAAAVDQLARLLAPHRVIVHHDFEKLADFALTAPNAELVKDPRVTGWGTWGFSDAILHTIRYALDHHDFDYFQLLSPTCLPIRPIAEFERFLAEDGADAHIDRLEVDGDDDTLMTFGYRTYMPAGSLRFRVLRRVRSWYFGEDADFVQTQSLSMLRLRGEAMRRTPSLKGRLGLMLTRFAAAGGLGGHPFVRSGWRPMIGGVFFGARRPVCEHLVRIERDEPRIRFFRNLQIVDETLFPTLIANSGFAVGQSNHAINEFTREGSPRWIEIEDLERLYATRRWFARKFIDQVDAPQRRLAIERVRGRSADRVPGPAAEPRRPTGRRGPQRLVFGLMSSQQPAHTVAQLVDALSPHPVVVHHDFDKRRDFALACPNAQLVPDPKLTGWGTAGFVEAIFHTLRFALREHDFDYFQLLSPTCLPIRPLEAYEAHVADDPADIHCDLMPVDEDDDVLMSFAYRAFVPGQTLRFRMLRRARSWYFGSDSDLIQTRSLSVLRYRDVPVAGGRGLARRAGLALTRMAADGRFGAHPYGPRLRPTIGSIWFGARRTVCEYLVRQSHDERTLGFFNRLHLVDETLFPTLLASSGFRIGASNHTISAFNENGNPRWIDDAELDRMFTTGRFFARKFPDDPESPVRRRALARAGADALVI